MARGGARRGAGRPRLPGEGWKNISVTMRPSQIVRLDRLLAGGPISRSAWIRTVIEMKISLIEEELKGAAQQD